MALDSILDESIADFANSIPLVGRRNKTPLSAAITGLVTIEDLRGREEVNAPPQMLKTIRTSHHRVARFLADGMTPIQVAAITGYSVDRIYGLQQDTVFKGLLKHYTDAVEEHITDTAGLVLDLANDALGVLSERMESDSESFTVKELTELSKVTLDRSGHSPVHKSENLNINCSAELVKEANDLIRKRNENQVNILDAREVTQAIENHASQNTKDKRWLTDSSETEECTTSSKGAKS